MKITKLGHCCLIVEVNGVRFLTDPGAYTTEQNGVKNIDCIIISHEHSDHLHIESLKVVLNNNPHATIFTNKAVGKILDQSKIKYQIVADGQTQIFKGIKIAGYGEKHAPIYKDYEQVENTGYMFDDKLFYPGDAFHDPGVDINILAFPVTGPWCKISEAMDYVLALKPKIAFAVHDGNLKRQQGITRRLPEIMFPKNEIKFMFLELGKEYEL